MSQKTLLMQLSTKHHKILELEVKNDYPFMYQLICKYLHENYWYIDLTYSEMSYLIRFIDNKIPMDQTYKFFENE